MENTYKWLARSQLCSCQNSNSMTQNWNPENHSSPWQILQHRIFILLLHPLIQWFSIFHKMLHSWSCHPSPTLLCQTIIRHCKMSNAHETVVEWKRAMGVMCALSTGSDQLDTSSPSESETLWPISASSVGLEIFLTPQLPRTFSNSQSLESCFSSKQNMSISCPTWYTKAPPKSIFASSKTCSFFASSLVDKRG